MTAPYQPMMRMRRPGAVVALTLALWLIAFVQTAAASVAAPVSQQVTPAAVAARREQSITVLADGRVLVVGGRAGGVLASAALFDPVRLTWSQTGSLAVARYNHSAILLADGRVLVIGGSDCERNCRATNSLASAELYDPRTGTWTRTADMTASRTLAAAIRLVDGRVLVAGGSGVEPGEPSTNRFPTLRSVELYDPTTGSWRATTPLRYGRQGASALALPNGQALLVGGFTFAFGDADLTREQASALSRAVDRTGERYDPTSGDWTPTAEAPDTSGDRFWWTALPDGRVLGLSGFYFERARRYDPVSDTWTRLVVNGRASQTPYPVVIPLLQLADGRVLASGGEQPGSASSTDEAFLFDPSTATWTATGRLNAPREEHNAVLLADGRALIFGGVQRERSAGAGYFGASRQTRTTELYDPATGIWTALDEATAPPLPLPPGVSAPCPVSEAGCALATKLGRALSAGDPVVVADQITPRPLTCLTEPENGNRGLSPLCDGAASGEQRLGYGIAFEHDVGGFFAKPQYEELLRQVTALADPTLSDAYGSGAVRVLGFLCAATEPASCGTRYAILISWLARAERTGTPGRSALSFLVEQQSSDDAPRLGSESTNLDVIVPGYLDGFVPWSPLDATP